MSDFEWNGDKVKKNIEKAAKLGINQTMAAAVKRARTNHPGWKNVTGLAEGSIRIQEFAKKSGKEIFGLWGSSAVDYMVWLEAKHGSALRNASDIEYRKFRSRVEEALKSGGGK